MATKKEVKQLKAQMARLRKKAEQMQDELSAMLRLVDASGIRCNFGFEEMANHIEECMQEVQDEVDFATK